LNPPILCLPDSASAARTPLRLARSQPRCVGDNGKTKRRDISFIFSIITVIITRHMCTTFPSALKPDALFVFEGNFAIHLEHDDTFDDERSEQRLAQIHSDAGTIGKTAVIRWCEHRGSPGAMCKRGTHTIPETEYSAAFYEITDRGKDGSEGNLQSNPRGPETNRRENTGLIFRQRSRRPRGRC